MQRQLAEREELFRQMTETVDEVFWATSGDAVKVLYLSPAYEQIFDTTKGGEDDRNASILRAVPPEEDPYLAELTAVERGYVRAGLSYYKAAVLRKLGSTRAADVFLQDFASRIPLEFAPDDKEDDVTIDFDP